MTSQATGVPSTSSYRLLVPSPLFSVHIRKQPITKFLKIRKKKQGKILFFPCFAGVCVTFCQSPLISLGFGVKKNPFCTLDQIETFLPSFSLSLSLFFIACYSPNVLSLDLVEKVGFLANLF
jgi:hypothetical protein